MLVCFRHGGQNQGAVHPLAVSDPAEEILQDVH
jgi:hypothetical protein